MAIPLVDPSTASAEVKEVFDDIERSRGTKVTSTWRFFAHDPVLLRHWWGLTKHLESGPGEVDKVLLHSIALICAAEVDCPRCINTHQTHLIDHFGFSAERAQQVINFEDSDLPGPWKSVFRFARKIAFCEETTEGDIDSLRACGYSDRGIVEIVSMALLESSLARRTRGVVHLEHEHEGQEAVADALG